MSRAYSTCHCICLQGATAASSCSSVPAGGQTEPTGSSEVVVGSS